MVEVSTAERLDRVAIWVAGTAVVVGVVLLGAHTIPNPNVTWDEAGQFWMTQGQTFGTPWGTPTGTLLEGLDLGRHGNILDPVGFTSLLWAWVSAFGAAPATLRALPFLFFLGTIVSAYLLGRRSLGLYRTPTLVVTTAVLTTYVSMQWATEVRPYAPELMGVVAAAAATVAYVRRPSWPGMVGLASLLLFFNLFSRYSFAFAAGTAMLVVLVILWRSGQLAGHWREVVFGWAVLALTGLFLAWNMGLFDAGDQVWDNYGNPIRVESITDFEHMRMLLQINFVYGWHKLTAAFIILGVAAWLVVRIALRRSSTSRLSAELRLSGERWIPLLAFVVVYEAVSAFASQMGWAQWNSEFRHSIGLIGVAVMSGLGLLVLGTAVLRAFVGRWDDSEGGRAPVALRWVGWVVWGLVLTSVLATTVRAYADFQRTDIETLGVSVPTRVASAVSGIDDVRWLVDTQLFPSLRYLVEASGVPLGDLEIEDAEAFGLYGHDAEKLLAWMRDANPCEPGRVTAILVAGSAADNAEVYSTIRDDVSALGCTLTVHEVSDLESLVVVR